jgi:hypothetical protein
MRIAHQNLTNTSSIISNSEVNLTSQGSITMQGTNLLSNSNTSFTANKDIVIKGASSNTTPKK